MLIEQTEVTALTLEDIQKQLQSVTIDRYWREPQWGPGHDVDLAMAKTIHQVKVARAALRPDQPQETTESLDAALQSLKRLEAIDAAQPAPPEQQAHFEQAWRHLEDARLSLCVTLYDRLHPMTGSMKGGPLDLSQRPHVMKHGLWPKEE